ncbi:helix-turn-helix transcriptional regulator [Melissococcus plutonius]|uniref:helix-turn-helix domain-containing protein n=1 Tax=Melissococcus plutonius TaxID=33970 RepID=UPI003EE49EC0
MNTLETLKFFRKLNKLTQKEMLNNQSKYRRIETQETTLSFDDWILLLQKLEITPKEFFAVAENSYDTKVAFIKKQYKKCCKDPYTTDEKNKLLKDFEQLNNNENKSLTELSIYINIKMYFHDLWEEVPVVNQKDIEIIQNKLENKYFYSHHCYQLFTNTALYFNNDTIDLFMKKMYPIEHINNRDTSTLYMAYLIYPNLATKFLFEKNYKKAEYYINQGQTQLLMNNYPYIKLQLTYLKNTLNYLIGNKKKDHVLTLKNIKTIKDLYGDTIAKKFKNEFEDLCMKVPLKTRLIEKNAVDTTKH